MGRRRRDSGLHRSVHRVLVLLACHLLPAAGLVVALAGGDVHSAW